MWVDDDCVFLIIPTETSRIEVGTAHGTESAIYHDNLGMMEARGVHPDIATFFHQLMGIIKSTVGCQRYITPCTEHNLNLHSSFYRIL